ncbi:MAG: family 16 glycosylhydrolase [Pseudomonadota bacterium]
MARNSIYLFGTGMIVAAILGGVVLARMNEPSELYADAHQSGASHEDPDLRLIPASLDKALPNPLRRPDEAPQAAETAQFIPEPRIEAPGKPFRDRFNRHRRDRWSISHGWRNGKWTINDWQRSQVKFDNGLRMTLDERLSPRADYAGAELQSRRRFGHGYYEVEMRAARASGVVSAFFTYTGPPFGDPWNEIDVEILGRKPREVMFTYFRNGEKVSHIHQLPFDASQGSHTYAFDWQPEHLRWYVDGRMVHESSPVEMRFPNMKQKLMTSIWGSDRLTDWVGEFDKESLPVSMTVTCIAYAADYASRKPCVEAD